ncbi:MAG: hypothetical protein U5K76_05040 [Woeseiaceae bacterium]|nr:hypothetical protein [Woeseiaceae bacterium]
MDITWLKDSTDRWRGQLAQARRPHAVLVAGAAGLGKRCLAAWLAESVLSPDTMPALPQYPLALRQHPDLHWLTRPDDKQNIVIEQIRQLIGELGLTSHRGKGKVAVIEAAHLMTSQAANSLLKTLEEPPGDALLILVADRMSRMPATILSRCQRLAVRLPDSSESLAWLDRLQPGSQWPRALRAAGGAPLAAVAAAERLEDADAMATDLGALAGRAASPVEVADRWSRRYPDLALDWLARQVQGCIVRRLSGAAGGTPAVVQDSVLQRMDSRNLFCYLDTINRLRAQAGGSYNLQLTLEGLLIDWAEGLVHSRGQDGSSGLWPLISSR